jgi:hypothetical protein
LEIEKNDELDDKLNDEFEVEECANFEVTINAEFEVKTNEYFKFNKKNQNSAHQEYQDSLDEKFNKWSRSTHQEDKDLPNNVPHSIQKEVSIQFFLQNTSYNDTFLSMYHLSSAYYEGNHITHLKIRKHLHLDAG